MGVLSMSATKADRARIAAYAINRLDGERYKIIGDYLWVYGPVPGSGSLCPRWWVAGSTGDILREVQAHATRACQREADLREDDLRFAALDTSSD